MQRHTAVLTRIRDDLIQCLSAVPEAPCTAASLFPAAGFDAQAPELDTPFLFEHAATAAFSALNYKIHGQFGLLDPAHCVLSLRGERYLQMNHEPVNLWDPMSGMYRAADRSLMMAQCNFPHHRQSFLRALGLSESASRAEADAAARAFPTAAALERAALAQGAVVGAVTQDAPDTPSPWRLIEITQRGRSNGPASAAAPRRHRRLRVLDVTRVLAGPVLAQTLCEAGLDVVTLTTEGLPQIEPARLFAGWGKRSCAVRDWTEAAALARTCDVLVQSMAPGKSTALERFVGDGCVVVDISAYSPHAARAGRKGFDSVVQCTSGMFAEQQRWTGSEEGHQPVQALDHLTGLFGALAVLHVLDTAPQNAGFRIAVSLEATARWVQGLGRRPQRVLGGLERMHKTLLRQTRHECALANGRVLGTIRNPLQMRRMLTRPEAVMGKASAAWAASSSDKQEDDDAKASKL